MSDILTKVLSEFLLAMGGSVITGIFWLAKSLYQAKRDIDCAHYKIRALEEKLNNDHA